jgi:hypothetical protein
MIKTIQSFFIWSAGSDNSILTHQDCPESEKIKHVGYGALVWIPAVVGFFSMSYAISTLTGDKRIVFSAAAAWSLIVFTIDRFIISTARKAEGENMAVKSSFWIRALFAAFVGIIVAHPVVLLVFDESIQKELTEIHRLEIDSLNHTYQNEIDAFEAKKNFYRQDLLKYDSLVNAQRIEVGHEAAGDVGHGRSGMYGDGPATAVKKHELQQMIGEQNELKGKDNQYRAKQDSIIKQIERRRDSGIADVKDTRDYLARETALSRIIQKHSIVGISQWLLIIFFVLLDILPVTFKTFTPIGFYDRMLSEIDKRKVKQIDKASEVRIKNSLSLSLEEDKLSYDKFIETRTNALNKIINDWVKRGDNNITDLLKEISKLFPQSEPKRQKEASHTTSTPREENSSFQKARGRFEHVSKELAYHTAASLIHASFFEIFVPATLGLGLTGGIVNYLHQLHIHH